MNQKKKKRIEITSKNLYNNVSSWSLYRDPDRCDIFTMIVFSCIFSRVRIFFYLFRIVRKTDNCHCDKMYKSFLQMFDLQQQNLNLFFYFYAILSNPVTHESYFFKQNVFFQLSFLHFYLFIYCFSASCTCGH